MAAIGAGQSHPPGGWERFLARGLRAQVRALIRSPQPERTRGVQPLRASPGWMRGVQPTQASSGEDRSEHARNLAIAVLGAYLLVYVSWQLGHWLPGRLQLGQAFLPPADALALCATLLAARRCAGSHALRAFWLTMSAAIAAELIADLLLLRNVIVYRVPPFPTLADPFFLAFYVLLFAALLRIPVAPATRARQVRMLLDGATIVLGAGAVVWYFVIGPTATAGGQSALAMAVSLAYPTGDLILLAGLAAVLLRRSPAILRTPLLLIAAGMVASIMADVVYGYGVLHGTYTNGDPIDTLYVAEFLLFALAAVVQRPIATNDPQALAGEWSEPAPRASWLPYVSVAVALGILFGVEVGHPFFPDASLTLIALVLMALVAARQHVAQRELVTTQAALRRSEQVKDEFLSIAGHELRTPLTSIRGSLGLLEGGVLGELPEDAAHMVSLALVNTDRLVRLVNDVLDIERMAAGRLELQPEPVDARELVRQSLQVLQASADAAKVRLERSPADTTRLRADTSRLRADTSRLRADTSRSRADTTGSRADTTRLRADTTGSRADTTDATGDAGDSKSITVLADADRIVQVLVNLVGNAIKFSPRGGVVRVTVARDEEGALFTVRDEGRGIPADKLGGVFERFQQVDASDARERGGTGLGLPIARGIVEQHDGRIWVCSREGEGSTFQFTLPAARELERPGSLIARAGSGPSKSPTQPPARSTPATERSGATPKIGGGVA